VKVEMDLRNSYVAAYEVEVEKRKKRVEVGWWGCGANAKTETLKPQERK
jgi:hypothetical protein